MADQGQFRVLPPPDGGGGDRSGRYRWLDRETYEPVVLAGEGHDAPVTDLQPGYLVDGTLDWSTGDPTVASLSLVRPTLYTFADGVDPMFEAAAETWERARSEGEPMGTRILENTDSEVVGVVYVFAESGDRGRFAEFRDGSRPLEPLIDRVNDRRDPAPREVFVLRAPAGEFTAVAIALDAGGHFADTMHDTYDLTGSVGGPG
jgi:hypothetical protein